MKRGSDPEFDDRFDDFDGNKARPVLITAAEPSYEVQHRARRQQVGLRNRVEQTGAIVAHDHAAELGIMSARAAVGIVNRRERWAKRLAVFVCAALVVYPVSIGPATLLRFYVLHCVAVPLIAGLLMAVHFWRVRKDGGISGPM